MDAIYARVTDELKRRGRTWAWLARELEVSDQVVSNWGRREIPSARYAGIAHALGWTIERLLGGAPDRPELESLIDGPLEANERRSVYKGSFVPPHLIERAPGEVHSPNLIALVGALVNLSTRLKGLTSAGRESASRKLAAFALAPDSSQLQRDLLEVLTRGEDPAQRE